MTPTTPETSFGILGPLSVVHRGQSLSLGGLKQRVVLGMLLMNAGRTVSVDRLIDGVWGDDPPEGAVNTVQVYVSHLRRVLASTEAAILTQPPGYLLRLTARQLDLLQFEELAQRAQDEVAARRPSVAADVLRRALDLWRGPPLEDLGAAPFAVSARTFLEERRLGAVDDELALLLELGRDREVIESCEQNLAAHPLRESLWERLILALYRSGRQADALARYRACRRILLDELGVEPTPRLQTLEHQILNQDRRLEPAPRRTGTSVVVTGLPGRPDSGTATVVRPRRLQSQLVLADGRAVPLGDRVVLGRHPDCDIVLDDASVSRRHAEIRLANGSHVLLDLSSSNGTWVRDQPVLQHRLLDGDTFQIGDQVLRYRTR
jgi:SARP family transcriptional regulator, regulator of embCAB operon